MAQILDDFFQFVYLFLLLFDLRLLLVDGIDENDSNTVVFDAFDFAFGVRCVKSGSTAPLPPPRWCGRQAHHFQQQRDVRFVLCEIDVGK